MKLLSFSMAAAVMLTMGSAFIIPKSGNPAVTAVNGLKPVQAPAKWVIDKAHTNIRFSVTHLVVSDVDGSFKSFDGSMTTGKPDFSDAVIIGCNGWYSCRF
jgi:polyisoprenoid-binding protein YceI